MDDVAGSWTPCVSVRMIQPALMACEAEGLDVAPILDEAGVSLERARDLGVRIPLPVATRVWEVASARSADPCFGLRAATLAPPGLYDVPEYAARKRETIGEGLKIFARFVGLIHDAVRIRFEDGDESVTMLYETTDAVPPPAAWAEYALCAFVLAGRRATGSIWAPNAMHFVHAARGDPSRFFEVVGVRPTYEQPHNALLIPIAVWQHRTIEADSQLAAILERYADALLQRRERTPSLAQRVREILAAELDGGDVSAEAVARTIGIPVRTLRRRLREEATTHRELLDELRQGLATRYLGDARLSADEVALLVGFSDASAFQRAFRRWTGQTVSEYIERTAPDDASCIP